MFLGERGGQGIASSREDRAEASVSPAKAAGTQSKGRCLTREGGGTDKAEAGVLAAEAAITQGR